MSRDHDVPLKVVIYGAGNVGQAAARLILERGMHIVGAIGASRNVGRDLGEVIGWHAPIGVIISADADAVLTEADADIALLTVGETAEQSLPHIERCITHGVNIFSMSEQMFFPWACAEDIAARIDTLARDAGVTVSAGGIQDVYWVNLVKVLSAASQSITAIRGVTSANAEDYGPALLKDNAIGEDAAAFRVQEDQTSGRPNVFTVGLQALAAVLGYRATGWRQYVRPLLAEAPVLSKALGREIAPGQILGTVSGSVLSTAEGVDMVGEIQLKIFAKGEDHVLRWTIEGDPILYLECPHLDGMRVVGTTVVNRLSDVVVAPAGLITVEQLPAPCFKPWIV